MSGCRFKVNVGYASFWGTQNSAIASIQQVNEEVTKEPPLTSVGAFQARHSWSTGGLRMKDLGIVTLISVAAIAAAPASETNHPTAFATAKSTQAFADCFAHSQERDSKAWWFVPKESGGGTFSNAGAPSVKQPYFVEISDRGSRREIHVQNASWDGPVARGVEQCI